MYHAKDHVSGCPKVTLNVQGKGVPSLLDSGSMVTLIWEGYFEKNILPLLKASSGELSQSSLIIQAVYCQQQHNASIKVF